MTAHIIARQVMGYEESETPLLITSTKESAEKIRDEIIAWMEALAAKLHPLPRLEGPHTEWNDDAWDEHQRLSDLNTKIHEEAVWPYPNLEDALRYGFQQNHLDDEPWTISAGCVICYELPFIESK